MLAGLLPSGLCAHRVSWSCIRGRKLTPTARIAPLGFRGHTRIHLLDRLRPALVGEAAEDILRSGWREGRHRPQQHAIHRMLHDQAGSGLPMQFITDRLGQNYLSLRGYGGGEAVRRHVQPRVRWR